MQRGLDVNQEAIARAELQGSREAGKPTKKYTTGCQKFLGGAGGLREACRGVHE